MKIYKIMPASLVTASFECNDRSREDSYSVIRYAEYYVYIYVNDYRICSNIGVAKK